MSVRTLSVSTHGRFLLDAPPASGPPYRLLVGFHGYGQNADQHLEQLRSIPGVSGWLLASVQGLHRFYSSRTREVVASWMTVEDRELAIADNVAYANRVVDAIRSEHETRALVFAGFSQGVAMTYRAALLGASRADGLIALAGDVPPDVQDCPGAAFPPVLIGRGTGDTWYTEQRLNADLEVLQRIGVNVRAVVFEGGHEWSDAFRQAAGEFLSAIPPDAPSPRS